MKKRALAIALSSLLFLGGLFSCSSNEKLDLYYGKIHSQDEACFYEEIDEEGLENLKANPLTNRFLLYYYETGCSGCKSFDPILKKVTEEKNLLVYGLDALSLSSDSDFKKKHYTTPTLLAYVDGEIQKSFSSTDDEEAFSDETSFLSFYEDHFKDPKALYLAKSEYEAYKESGKSFVVEFINQNCSDCQYVQESFLDDYLNAHDDIVFYMVDKAEVISGEEEKQEAWDSFKLENGLCASYADGSSNSFGFDTGFTPTFQYRVGQSIQDAEIPYETYDNESKTIVRKYYEDDLSIGTSFASEKEYKENRKEFYNAKLEDFFDTNLKKANEDGRR